MSVRVYCHSCSENRLAARNADQELQCSTCESVFVEEEGQSGLDEFFVSTAATPAASDPRATAAVPATATSTLPSDASAHSARPEVIDRILNHISESASAHNGQGGDMPAWMGQGDGSNANGNRSRGRSRNQRNPFNVGAPNLAEVLGLGGEQGGFIGALLGRIGTGGSLDGNAMMNDFMHHILMNEQSTAGAPPATDSAIKKLEKVPVTEANVAELEVCHITQEPFEVGGVAIRLPCNHHFHQTELEKWLRMHGTCPVCRDVVGAKGAEEEEEEEDDDSSDDDDTELPPLAPLSARNNNAAADNGSATANAGEFDVISQEFTECPCCESMNIEEHQCGNCELWHRSCGDCGFRAGDMGDDGCGWGSDSDGSDNDEEEEEEEDSDPSDSDDDENDMPPPLIPLQSSSSSSNSHQSPSRTHACDGNDSDGSIDSEGHDTPPPLVPLSSRRSAAGSDSAPAEKNAAAGGGAKTTLKTETRKASSKTHESPPRNHPFRQPTLGSDDCTVSEDDAESSSDSDGDLPKLEGFELYSADNDDSNTSATAAPSKRQRI